MSVSGISSSSLYNTQSAQSSFQQAQQLFQQLGKDLQAGNLPAAQSDFTSLQNLLPQTNSTATAQSSNPIAQAFAQLGKDLQSGNLSAAQQDFTTIQQDAQSQAQQTEIQAAQGHHHHHGGGGSSEISQLFAQLGSALQSGDLSSAQQAFSSLTQQFQQSAQPSAAPTESPASSSGGVSISA
jgi:outer membrane protein assembly factor BamD (BamD/ComL family)